MAKINIRKLRDNEILERKIKDWPIWEKEVSRFDWTYSAKEECLILEGEFDVETEDGVFHVEPGDFVTFLPGLNCTWNIKTAVKKYYNFE